MDNSAQKKQLDLARYALNHVPYGISILDQNHKIVSWNQQAERIFGYKQDDVLGKPIHPYFLQQRSLIDSIKQMANAFQSHHNDSLEKEANLIGVSKNGKQKALKCTIKPLMISESLFFTITTEQINMRPDNPGQSLEDRRGVFILDLTPEDSNIDNNSSEWLLSYVDVMTLLVVLFVLIYSLTGGALKDSEQAKATIAEQMVSISNREGSSVIATGTSGEEGILINGEGILHNPVSNDTHLKNDYDLQSQMLSSIKDSNLINQLEIVEQDSAISLRMKEKILFPSGFTDLTTGGEDLLYELAKILAKEPYHITVEGHSDRAVISTKAIPSNWELSSIRAATVVRYLIDGGVNPQRLRSVGYADTKPLVKSNKAIEPSNRRVELIIHLEVDQ